jgi:hypothetical protein
MLTHLRPKEGSLKTTKIATEAWNQSGLTLQASGMALSASSVALTLDGSSLGSVTPVDNRWTAALSLSAGSSHTLSATAIYNNGLPSTAANNRQPTA